MKLAVLSDLHIGKFARCPTLRPEDTASATEGIVDDLIGFLEASKLAADYLVLPGDIGEFAKPAEISLGSQISERIAKALRIPEANIVFVPGNHDVDWSVLKESDSTGFRWNQRYAPITGPDWLFNRVAKNAGGQLFTDPYFGRWDFADLHVTGFNSSWHDDPNEAIHHGKIAPDHIRAIDEELSKNPPPRDKTKLFLVHHHSYPQPNPVPDEPEFSALINSAELLMMLQRHRFDLLIHGHRHCPLFQTHSVNSGHPLVVLSAGSFSLKLPEDWTGLVGNQFHILELDGRAASGTINGRLKSWSFVSGRGWSESQLHQGIRHISPFGAHLLPVPLQADIAAIIDSEIQTHRTVTWAKIISIKPEYKYLPTELVLEIVAQITRDRGLKRLGDPSEEMVIWKEPRT